MHHLHNHIFLLCLFLLISSCSTDDECTIDDWVGTYTAETSCNITGIVDGAQRDTTITQDSAQKLSIMKIDDQTIIMTNGAEINFETTVLGCEISIDSAFDPEDMFGIGDANYVLEKNQITGVTKQNFSELEFLCETLFTKEN